METTIRLKISELPNLTKTLNLLFKKEDTIEVIVTDPSRNSLGTKETRAETRLRIRRAFEKVRKGEGTVSFTPEEFEKYSAALSAKYRK